MDKAKSYDISEVAAQLEKGKTVAGEGERNTASIVQTLAMDAAKRFERTSRMRRESHVRFCEGLRVKLPWATRRNAGTF
jgi:hypothetical protein